MVYRPEMEEQHGEEGVFRGAAPCNFQPFELTLYWFLENIVIQTVSFIHHPSNRFRILHIRPVRLTAPIMRSYRAAPGDLSKTRFNLVRGCLRIFLYITFASNAREKQIWDALCAIVRSNYLCTRKIVRHFQNYSFSSIFDKHFVSGLNESCISVISNSDILYL